MLKTFPKYPNHQVASCFNCGSDLNGYWCTTGHAVGNGHFRQDCDKCDMATWYDLKTPEVAA